MSDNFVELPIAGTFWQYVGPDAAPREVHKVIFNQPPTEIVTIPATATAGWKSWIGDHRTFTEHFRFVQNPQTN